MKTKTIIALSTVLTLCLILTAFVNEDADAATETCEVLIDHGNGNTEWTEVPYSDGSTIDSILKTGVSDLGMTYSSSGNVITIDELTTTTIGGGNGNPSFTLPGTSSVKVTSSWIAYIWNNDKWETVSTMSSIATSDCVAVGFYPAGCVPTDTPNTKNAWTMIRGDSEQSGSQTANYTTTDNAIIKWTATNGSESGVYSSILIAGDYAIAKFGSGMGVTSHIASVKCFDRINGGEPIWTFQYNAIAYYETSTPLVVSDYVYVGTGMGNIYKIPLDVGPGTNNVNVKTFDGAGYSSTKTIPYETGAKLIGKPYSTGTGSLVYDSGCIFCYASNGMVYCFDMDLKLIWSYQMSGHTYYMSPSIKDGYVFAGALDGSIYVLDKQTGELIAQKSVYTEQYKGSTYGGVSGIAVFSSDDNYNIITSFTSGRGMESNKGGMAIYSFDGKTLTQTYYNMNFGLTGNYSAKIETSNYSGVIFEGKNGLYKLDVNGRYALLNSDMYPIKGAPVIVNGECIYVMSYTAGKPTYMLDINGKILSTQNPPTDVRNYGMSEVTVMNDHIYLANDSGAYCVYGVFEKYLEPSNNSTPWYIILIYIAITVIAILAIIYAILRFIKKIDRPFEWINEKASYYIHGEDMSHNTKSKHRLLVVLSIGTVGSVLMFLACLCLGSGDVMSIPDTLGALFSAIGKGGQNLTYEELVVYNSRLPRTLAALAVGIGLSVAGSVYQAIIRNPMVDPYIMGVSSGAGTAAIAVIAFNFTFFGLFSTNSIYLTAIAAMVGGVIAFFITMLLAEKAGGSSVNYVLSGVVVGLAFGAAQTLMLSMSGEHLMNSMTWLFGSFANVSWIQVGLIVIPAITMSIVPLFWAKEFNLVLLGEDQAQQMGLNVRRFNRLMLILASLLTAICVAFVGIIGFVGLVIPHLCRMILGGDHRLVLPMSIAFGGILMMGADLVARMLMYGQELPVGAITTIIGVPMFAYLLVKRGRMYDG